MILDELKYSLISWDNQMSDGREVRAFVFANLCCLVVPAYASTTSEMHRTKAISALGDGQLELARNELERAVLADEGDLHARFYRGIVYSRMGDYEKAKTYYLSAVRQDKRFETKYAYLGMGTGTELRASDRATIDVMVEWDYQ